MKITKKRYIPFAFISTFVSAAFAFAPLMTSAATIPHMPVPNNGYGQAEAALHANAHSAVAQRNDRGDGDNDSDDNGQFALGPVSPTPLAVNTMPVISGITAPVVLKTGATGTWTVNAFDPQNSPLTYSVDWGDNAPTPLLRAALLMPVFTQTGTFTHAYANPGTYTVTFTVKNSTGQMTTSTVTVHVTGQAQITPTVSNLTVTNVKAHQATLTWSTDVKAKSQVWIATSTPVDTTGSANVIRNANVTNHSVVLTKLEQGTTYYVVVGSENQTGTGMSPETSFITPTIVNKNAPTINSLTGSTTVAVNDIETVTVNATDPHNSPLTYSVDWRDNPPIMMSALMARVQPVEQTSTFTHAYANPGTYTALFTVKNAAGLSTSSSLVITVTPATTSPDTIPPVITLNGSSTVNLMIGDTYTELGATATDNVDGTDPVIISGDTVNTAVVGTYHVDYNATDNAGNHAIQVVRTVNVNATSTATTTPDTTAPVISDIGGSTGSTTAIATWTTDEPATSEIFYSTNTPVDTNSSSTPFVFDPALVTSHTLNLTGLTPGTLYHFVLESADASNNVAATFESTFTTSSQ